jgi:hypothetical protein
MPYSESHEKEMMKLYESLSEKDRRRYAAVEARKLGHGGIAYVCSLFGCTDKTVRKGMMEMQDAEALNRGGVRKPGGGRKSAIDSNDGIDEAFQSVLDDHTAGDPMNDKVKWTALSLRAIAKALKKRIHGKPKYRQEAT